MSFTKEDTRVLKGISVLIMLYHHLFAYPDRVLECWQFKPLISFGGVALATFIAQFFRFGLTMFIFLGGYGLYISFGKAKDTGSFITGRIVGLYRQVWMVFFLSLPFSVYVHRAQEVGLVKDVIYNAVGLSCSFNEEWWFIVPYVILLILFPAVKRFLDRDRASVITDCFLVVIYSGFYNYILQDVMKLAFFEKLSASVFWDKINVALGMLPAFALGCIFSKYGLLNKLKEKAGGKPVWCIAAALGFVVVFYLSLYNDKFYNFVNGTIMICCFTVLLPLKILKWPFKLIGKIAEESTFMWLTHTFFCYYWCQRIVYAPKYSVLIYIWLVVISYAAAKLIRLFWKTVGKIYKKIAG